MSQWIPPLVHAVPDINKLRKYHYLPVAETPITNTDDSKEEKWKIIGHVQSESTKRMKSISRRVQVFRPFATDTLLKKVL